MRKTLCWFSFILIAALHSYAAPAARVARDPKYDLLVSRLDSVTLNISVTPFASPSADPGGGLRSALFWDTDGVFFIEQEFKWGDGSYVNDGAHISQEAMLRVLDVLDRGGFLVSAETYYSERVLKPQGPPPTAKHIRNYLDLGQRPQVGEFRLNCFDENYYTEYIIVPSWDRELVPLLTELQDAVGDRSAKALLTQLAATVAMKVPAKK